MSACPLSLFLLAVLLFPKTACALPPGTAGGSRPQTTAQELKSAARALRLSDDRYWRILLHYKDGLSGPESLVDDPRFFLSPRGKTDPAAELEAAIDGLFAGGTDEASSPRCRFPARMEWIVERLAVDGARLPPALCGYVDNVSRRIDPRTAVLVFASGHMNSPASMFGHTFLRFDSSYESPLLSHAVNYAAEVDRRDNGLFYAFKGIFGYYPGYYSILNYYDKVKEYRDLDQRDMWEYPLDLPQDNVRRMLLHTLELQGIRSDYYFFKENCSYNLLFLVEVGAPSARLTDRFSGWTIPADTLKAALDEGMLAKPVFRPSKARKIRHLAEGLDARGKALANAVVEGRVPPREVLGRTIPDDAKGRLLDVAAETLQLRYAKKGLAKEVFQGRFLEILDARSRVPDAADDEAVAAPERPEQGHESSRMSLGAGVRDGDAFLEAAYRPAYHDILDPDAGFTPGSQIEFADLTIRYRPGDGRLRLHRWNLVNIVSLAPRDDFFRPVSWKFRAGGEDRIFPGSGDSAVALVNPGGGFTWETRAAGLLSLMVETEAAAGHRFDKRYAAGVGASGGLLRSVGDGWKIHVSVRRMFGVMGDRDMGTETSGRLQSSVRLGRNDSILLDAGRTVRPGVGTNEARLSWRRCF